jgi:hypothetical protein
VIPSWIYRVCGRNLPAGFTSTARPWSIELDGEPHLVATNGHRLVALRGIAGLGRPLPRDEVALRDVVRAAAAPAAIACSLGELRRFLETHFGDAPSDCGQCGNLGEQRCPECRDLVERGRRTCEICDGAGVVDCPCCRGVWRHPQIFKAGASYINALVLSLPLRHLEGDRARWHQTTEPDGLIAITTHAWTLVFTAMRASTMEREHAGAPVYDVGLTRSATEEIPAAAGSGHGDTHA